MATMFIIQLVIVIFYIGWNLVLAKGYSVTPVNITQVKDEIDKIKGATRDIMAQETMDRLTTKKGNE